MTASGRWSVAAAMGSAAVAAAILFWGTSSRSAIAQVDAAQPHSDEVFRNLIAGRIDAFMKGDTAGYGRLIADEFVHVMDDGVRRTHDELLAIVSANKGSTSRFDVVDLHSMAYGQLAVVDCKVVEHSTVGSREVIRPMHESDVFIWRGGRWLFLQHQETVTVAVPKGETLDARTLDDYVGRYEWWPGFVDIITRKGNTLYGQDTEDGPPTPFIAASAESFFIAGDPELMVFARDRTGKVTHYVLHSTNGRVVVARKLASGRTVEPHKVSGGTIKQSRHASAG